MKNKWLLIGFLILVPLFGTSQPTEKVLFSVPGGFYDESPVLELFPFYQQHHIRFTTNGNRPTAQSRLYTGPLLLDGSLYSHSDIYTIVDCPEQEFFSTDSVSHCIVIRAAVFDENDNCISEVATNSYFIRSLGCDTHGLPVVSLCADSLDLFDHCRGIMVPGAWASPSIPEWTGNYFCKGPEWERNCHVEFYESDNTGINQRAGLRTHGGASRRFQQKGLKIFAREEYGTKRFDHPFFPENPTIESYKHLILKPFRCSNWRTTGIQDQLAQQVARSLDMECLASRQAVLFLNGEYWGIYAVEESPDERYLEDHFGVDPEECNIIKQWIMLDEGSDSLWNMLYQWMLETDLSDDISYHYLSEQMDIDNFIDYQVFELYSSNVDWPKNNVRCWQHNDGRWRWIFYDGDGCFFRDWDSFANAVDTSTIHTGSNPSSFQSTLFFRKLLDNQVFRNRFRERFEQLMDSPLQYDRIALCFHALCDQIEAEVPSQCDRFGFPSSVAKWREDVECVDAHLRSLNDTVRIRLARFLNQSDIPESTLSFLCFPNPFDDHLYLEYLSDSPQTRECSIYNVLGQEIHRETIRLDRGRNLVLITPSLPSGIYFLKIDQSVIKLIRQ